MNLDNIETHILKPFIPQNSNILLLGSFPPPQARWSMQFYYPNFNNDMWRIFGLAFMNDKMYFVNLEQKTFYQDKIMDFLRLKGIAIGDSALKVQRLKGNADDKFLEVKEALNLSETLKQMPNCKAILTTGTKACEVVLEQAKNNGWISDSKESIKVPKTGEYLQAFIPNTQNNKKQSIRIYRMPSSSRAYPLSLDKKAKIYKEVIDLYI
ncbi:G:T/U mismatch-specific DNA glycosylase [Campylobacter pinnipediorum subsp. pinnipediorum]|uniref:uracil-DNA glycosylase family protein n=2 Tax=Campylobacter pinnipediorum TaxID=1965231 RepID=UPI000995976A|nr:uracil-DNA glycosylase family protein [Campylobacter pinnipediorum]AQW84281.1 G:T/U mismatch-specific DNA glycosylase [Campylobacter pinnipediorum subsp. pinnipediorum]